MKKVFLAITVCIFSAHVFAQSEGGIITKSTTGDATLSPFNTEQALNAMVMPYTCKNADSTKVGLVSTKYGSHYRLCRIANLSATTQKLVVVILNTDDTCTVVIPATSASERLPFIKRVLSGAVVDSTRYDFLYK